MLIDKQLTNIAKYPKITKINLTKQIIENINIQINNIFWQLFVDDDNNFSIIISFENPLEFNDLKLIYIKEEEVNFTKQYSVKVPKLVDNLMNYSNKETITIEVYEKDNLEYLLLKQFESSINKFNENKPILYDTFPKKDSFQLDNLIIPKSIESNFDIDIDMLYVISLYKDENIYLKFMKLDDLINNSDNYKNENNLQYRTITTINKIKTKYRINLSRIIMDYFKNSLFTEIVWNIMLKRDQIYLKIEAN